MEDTQGDRPSDPAEMIEVLFEDRDLCLRIEFPVSHTAQILTAIKGGYLVSMWEDPKMDDIAWGHEFDDAVSSIDRDDVEAALVSRDETPFADE